MEHGFTFLMQSWLFGISFLTKKNYNFSVYLSFYLLRLQAISSLNMEISLPHLKKGSCHSLQVVDDQNCLIRSIIVEIWTLHQ